jgi:hypothetical protein
MGEGIWIAVIGAIALCIGSIITILGSKWVAKKNQEFESNRLEKEHQKNLERLKVEHTNEISYMKKEYFFKEKISLFEKIGGLTAKNHIALTTIENRNKLKLEDKEGLDILKQVLKMNVIEFGILMDKLIFFSDDLRKNLGKYISLFEGYINDKDFGKEKKTKELRAEYKPFMIKINETIQKELNEIK